jgi:hypothetical protein
MSSPFCFIKLPPKLGAAVIAVHSVSFPSEHFTLADLSACVHSCGMHQQHLAKGKAVRARSKFAMGLTL